MFTSEELGENNPEYDVGFLRDDFSFLNLSLLKNEYIFTK